MARHDVHSYDVHSYEHVPTWLAPVTSAHIGAVALRQVMIALVLVAALAAAAGAAPFEQLTPGDGIPNIQFQHLKVNEKGQFLAVANAQVWIGDLGSGRIRRVLANDRLGFLFEDSTLALAHDKQHRMDLAIMGTRVALNAKGDYILGSHTKLFIGNITGGEPRKVYEDAGAMIQEVAINDAGHYLVATRRGLLSGVPGDPLAHKLLTDAPGTFQSFDVLASSDGNYDVEVGQTHLELNQAGQFLATSTRAVYGGTVPNKQITKIYENNKVGFRQLKLLADGSYVVVSARNVYRGKL